jgi:lipoprotein-anchoring transpeptidase ErfK/SrfK
MVFRLGIWLVGLAAAAAAVGASAPAAGQAPKPIARGVSVYGVGVGGLTSEPARAILREAFSRPVTFVYGEKSWQVGPGVFGGSAAVNDAVTRALASPPSREVHLSLAFDRKRIERYIARLTRRYSFPAEDTKLVGLEGLRPAFTTPKDGRRLRAARLVRAVEHLLETGARNPLTLTFRPVAPKVTPQSYGPVVVIRRESRRLTLFQGPTLVRTLPIATGTAEFPTPLGAFSIVDKQRHPWWYPPDSDWAEGLEPVPPGPGNPLGTRWMGLSAWGVGIHATPDAASVGYSASHGCIRMYVSDAEWLFEQVGIGTPVYIASA